VPRLAGRKTGVRGYRDLSPVEGQHAGGDFVETLCQGVPRERRALDSDRELDYSLERGQFAQVLGFKVSASLWSSGSSVLSSPPSECSWIDIIALNERMSLRACSTGRPFTAADIIDADDWLMEQPGRRCAGREHAVVHFEVNDDLVATERIESLHAVRGRYGQFAAVAWRTVVVEDDLPVKVFEACHGGVVAPSSVGVSQPKNAAATSRASESAWMSSSPL